MRTFYFIKSGELIKKNLGEVQFQVKYFPISRIAGFMKVREVEERHPNQCFCYGERQAEFIIKY